MQFVNLSKLDHQHFVSTPIISGVNRKQFIFRFEEADELQKLRSISEFFCCLQNPLVCLICMLVMCVFCFFFVPSYKWCLFKWFWNISKTKVFLSFLLITNVYVLLTCKYLGLCSTLPIESLILKTHLFNVSLMTIQHPRELPHLWVI